MNNKNTALVLLEENWRFYAWNAYGGWAVWEKEIMLNHRQTIQLLAMAHCIGVTLLLNRYANAEYEI